MPLEQADSAAIVRAHQKDSYYESHFHRLVQEVVKPIKGQRFLMQNQQFLESLAKFGYLALTTLAGTRTLGEEYVDLIYLHGGKLASWRRKFVFVFSYALLPLVLKKILQRKANEQKSGEDDEEKTSWIETIQQSLQTAVEINLAVFYMRGVYYSVSKRVTGLKYFYGRQIEPAAKQQQKSNRFVGYEVLGALMALKIGSSLFSTAAQVLNKRLVQSVPQAPENEKPHKSETRQFVYNLKSASQSSKTQIDLHDPSMLPYLKGSSRNCMLCLSAMTNPVSLPCGHTGCWDCMIDWCQDHNDCPLCRRDIDGKFLPLR